MRFVPLAFAAAVAVLATFGGTETSLAKATRKIDPAAVMHERHEGMESIGKNFKTLHRELDAAEPDLTAVRGSASTIADLSKKASGWFPAGTGPELGKTGAKPEIWQTPQDFAAKLITFQKAAQAYKAIVAGNDVSAMKAGFANLGGTCKACHDKYRAEMKH